MGRPTTYGLVSKSKITAIANQIRRILGLPSTSKYSLDGMNSALSFIYTKDAATYTPGTSSQTIPNGYYLRGAQTIQGDANLVASNIKSGVSIFGVNGSFAGGTPTLADISTTGGSSGISSEYFKTCTAFVLKTQPFDIYLPYYSGPYFSSAMYGSFTLNSVVCTGMYFQADNYYFGETAINATLNKTNGSLTLNGGRFSGSKISALFWF